MKRIFAGLMCMMIVLSLCGCGEEPLSYNMKQIKKASFNEEFRLNHSTYGATCWKYRFTDDGHTISETRVNLFKSKFLRVFFKFDTD